MTNAERFELFVKHKDKLKFTRCLVGGLSSSGLISAGFGESPDLANVRFVSYVSKDEWHAWLFDLEYAEDRERRRAIPK